jgi:hypothetical protein
VLLVDKPKAAPEGGGLDVFFGGPTGLFSKALRDCAKAYDVGSLDAMGLDRDVIFKQVQNSCLRLARNNAQTQCSMLENFKIDYLQGEATLDLGRFNGRPSTDTAKLVVRPTETPSETIDILANKVLLSLVRVGVRVRHAHNLGRCDARRSPPGSRWSSLASVCASLRARARERERERARHCVCIPARERERERVAPGSRSGAALHGLVREAPAGYPLRQQDRARLGLGQWPQLPA